MGRNMSQVRADSYYLPMGAVYGLEVLEDFSAVEVMSLPSKFRQ